jgi:Mn2+/Fe2+ NRAMP family transporter
MALCSAVLMLYFQASALFAAVLTRPEADAVAELRHLCGTINPVLLLVLLLKAALFGAIAAGLTLQQGLRELRQQRNPARRMADSVLISVTVLLIIDLGLVVVLDPLRIGANG